MDLSALSTAALEEELRRRREAVRLAEEAERKAREVEIVCYVCKGKGRIYSTADTSHWQCSTCSGTGKITALLAK
jgi:RecJ-like exonuclease